MEGGFLDGLSVDFADGLNVIIGPRGVGKTSVVELIRYAFGTPGYTERSSTAALVHARSVLQGGRVTATATEGSRTYIYTRSVEDDAPRVVGAEFQRAPIVLSQNEIEQVGIEPESRMRLLDGFTPPSNSITTAEDAAAAMIASITVEIQSVARSMLAAEERADETTTLQGELEAARARQAEIAVSAEDSEAERVRVEALSARGAGLEVRRDALERTHDEVRTWLGRLEQDASAPKLSFPSAGGDPTAVEHVRAAVVTAQAQIADVAADVLSSLAPLQLAATLCQSQLVMVQDEARDLRRALETRVEGAGQAAQDVAKLLGGIARRDGLVEEAARLRAQIKSLRSERRERLADLDSARQRRFDQRNEACEMINAAVGPFIHMRVDRGAGVEAYIEAITLVLQGSGLHLKNLAPHIASRVSPRELVEAVESGEVAHLAAIAGVSEERAARIIAAADKASLELLLTSKISDYVEVTFLDEAVPKVVKDLSTGQRCTAILPILLLHQDRVLVLDQPEDHLDNAYVVDTLVRSLKDRTKTSQTIIATHNANIPVLAEADRVILLGSDGKRGFCRLAQPLVEPRVVESISRVMEGGADAFNRRSDFYGRHLDHE